jgi:predicted DNA-binding transcriptional regulator YafY
MPFNKKRHTLARQWELLKRLPTRGAGKTAAELTQELQEAGFEVSKRQVERDLSELMDAFDLDCNNASIPYGWRWLPGAGADLPGLTLPEALSLSLVEDLVKALLPVSLLQGLETRFKQSRKKLDDLAPKNSKARWINKVRTVQPTQPLLAPHIDQELLNTVQECLLADEVIDADYRGMGADEAQSLGLNPLGLVNRGPITYLVATAWGYTDIRIYAMHRFIKASRTYKSSQKPVGFSLDKYIDSGALHFGSGKIIRLKANVSDSLARILLETPLSEDQKIDGNKLAATVTVTWQLTWWILSQGSAITVTAPAVLQKDIRVTLADTLTLYDSEAS